MINLFKAEFMKYCCEVKSYYPDHIGSIVLTYIFFIGFFLGLRDVPGDNFLHIGFIYWFYASTIISESSISISEEKQIGTFEQLLLKPTNILSILTVRTCIWIVVSTIKIAITMILVTLTLRIHLAFDYRIIFIFLISFVGLYGFGLLLASLTLRFTKTASFEGILSYFLLFFTGGVISLNNLPHVFKVIANILPITQGINISKYILKYGKIDNMDLLFLIVNSAIYFLIGIFIFILVQNKVRKLGLNTRY